MSHIITIDVGTSSTKTALWNDNGSVVSEATQSYPLHRPERLCAELDANVWWGGICATVRQVVANSDVDVTTIAGIGVHAVGWTLVPVDEQVIPLLPAMIWLDRRASEEATWLSALAEADRLVNLVGNPIDPAYITPKLLWLKHHHPRIFAYVHRYLNATGLLTAKLSGQSYIDTTQAYGYHFFDIARARWDADAADMIGISLEKMPRLC